MSSNILTLGLPCSSDSKESACNAGDQNSIPGSSRSSGEGCGNPPQHSCLENPIHEEPGGLQFMGSQRVRYDWATNTITIEQILLLLLIFFSSVHSVMSNSLRPQRQASLSITNFRSLLKLRFNKLVIPSNHLTLCHPLLFLSSIFPSIRVFLNESVLCIRWPKYWSFHLSISPYNEYSGQISFRVDWFALLAVWGILKSLLQHHISKPSVLQCSAFIMIQLSHPYMTTGKTIALTRQTFVGKEMSLLFNILSRLVIAFLPARKHLLISWLQSPSAVILEPKKIKSLTVFTVSPSICHEVMGPDAMILVFWKLSIKPTFSTLLFHFHQEAL